MCGSVWSIASNQAYLRLPHPSRDTSARYITQEPGGKGTPYERNENLMNL
jgi:hypothetical protein